jgi:hypothetical protein
VITVVEGHMLRGRTPQTTVLILVWSSVVTCAQTPSRGGLTVEQAVREALDHNLNLLTERFNVNVADTAIVTAI